MLLSIDWDAYSACRDLVFDAPIWGSRDRASDRSEAWRARALKRDPQAQGWEALDQDFPLLGDWQALKRYAGRPAFVAWSHAHAWSWLEQFPGRDVLNVDSHHDLYSGSGDPARLRPGNWAGLGLAAGLISTYTISYPAWHAALPVAEGHDLGRTWDELRAHLADEALRRVHLRRDLTLPPKHEVEALLLVQSPSWSSPAHDPAFEALAALWGATPLSGPYVRPWFAAEPLN